MLRVLASRIFPRQLGALAPLFLRRWDGSPAPLETAVRVGHDGDQLYVEYDAEHHGLHVDPTLPTDQPAQRLWEHDVVELFLSDHAGGVPYREIEISPLGQWLALRFDDVRVQSTATFSPRLAIDVERGQTRFRATLKVPLDDLSSARSRADWRIGLFRIAGPEPRRDYFSLPAMPGSRPDFHQPGKWLPLDFE